MIVDSTNTADDENFATELQKLNEQSKKAALISSTPSTTITTTPSSTITNIDNESALIPIASSTNDSNGIPQIVTNTAENTIVPITPVTPAKPAFTSEQAKVEIKNGTMITGWAGSEKTKLQAKGFTVSGTGNTPTRDYKSIHIYDVSGNAPQSLAELKRIYGVSSSGALPTGVTSNADVLIILGK